MISVVLVSCTTWGPVDSEKADLHLRMGTSLLENGNYPQALTELLNAQQLDPSNAMIQNNLGLAYFARGKNETALVHLSRAVDLNPKYTEAKSNKGRVLVEVERYSEADQILRSALEDLTFPQPDKLYLNLGLSLFRQKKYKEAKGQLEKSLEFQRSSCLGQTLYGRSLFELKDFSAAASVLDRAIGYCKNEQVDEPQYYSALAYYQMGDQRRAETRLEEIVKIYSSGRYRERARSMLDTMRK